MKKQILFCAALLLMAVFAEAQITNVTKALAKTDVLVFNKTESEYLQARKELAQLEKEKTQLLAMMEAFDQKQKTATARIQRIETNYDSLIAKQTVGGGQSQLLNATKQMQEMQMSFNLQYLQLQSQMQHENRSYTAVSNIMKTKHDTVKNSISNVR
jgi:hypothetical protein